MPPGPKGSEAVEIIYTYDVNSLLEVEVHVCSTGFRKRIVIQNDQNKLTDEEAAARLEKLQYLKLSPRDEEKNRLQLLRAERLYEEAPPQFRPVIDRTVMEFEQALNRQDRLEIQRARKKITKILDDIEFGSTDL